MFLYLTSLAGRTLDNLVPYLPKPPKDLKVAFIPTAADLYAEKPWISASKQKFLSLGFNVEEIDIKNFSKEELRKKLLGSDIIFVDGGTTTYLLDVAKKTGFYDITLDLVKSGKIYIGGSAGAVFAGPTIEVDRIYDHRHLGKELNSYQGLHLTETVILPHADNKKYELIIKEIVKKFGKKFKLQKLNDNQAFLVINGKEKIIEG